MTRVNARSDSKLAKQAFRPLDSTANKLGAGIPENVAGTSR